MSVDASVERVVGVCTVNCMTHTTTVHEKRGIHTPPPRIHTTRIIHTIGHRGASRQPRGSFAFSTEETSRGGPDEREFMQHQMSMALLLTHAFLVTGASMNVQPYVKLNNGLFMPTILYGSGGAHTQDNVTGTAIAVAQAVSSAIGFQGIDMANHVSVATAICSRECRPHLL